MNNVVCNAKKILLAEDNAGVTKVVLAYLEREGFEAFHASNGEQALELIELIKPDFIVLDIKMPKKDGLEVLKELREKYTTPVMIISAVDTNAVKLRAFEIGADDYMVKPFNPMELVTRIHVIFRRTDPAQEHF